MTDTQKYDLFMEYVGYKSADVYAEKFGVSPRTIDRYRAKDTVIPNTIIRILELSKENETKNKTIDNLRFELTSIKQCINDFKTIQSNLFKVVD